jgi:uncharacterized protein YicC (UPF0701 family)
MADKKAKIENLRAKLMNYRSTLQNYGELFNEDGYIDTEEQKQLDEMQAVIDKAERKLEEMEQGELKKRNREDGGNIKSMIDESITALEKKLQIVQGKLSDITI